MSAKTAASSVRLSESLKALIAAPHALGSAIPAPPRPAFQGLFNKISSTAEKNGAKNDVWLTLSTGALVTVNSPASLCELYDFASEKRGKDLKEQIRIAAIMREVGLKCIGFSGIPRTINALGALRAHLSEDVKAGLSSESLRQPTEHNVNATQIKARSLWDGIYEPHASKLLAKLAQSHPDLPVHILSSHYGPLFSDPVETFPEGHYKIGRVLTSVVAIACLRAQQGVGPQLTSHVFGLKKALLEGGGAEGEAPVDGQEWLTSDEGVKWALESVDGIAEVVVGRGRSSFAGAPGDEVKAKL